MFGKAEKPINHAFEKEGQAAVLSSIRTAFIDSKMVSAAAVPRFRQTLLDEYQLRGGNTADLGMAKRV